MEARAGDAADVRESARECERVESRACARKQAELGAGVAEPTSSTNSVQLTPQMCVNPRANARMGRRLWLCYRLP